MTKSVLITSIILSNNIKTHFNTLSRFRLQNDVTIMQTIFYRHFQSIKYLNLFVAAWLKKGEI